MAEDARYLRTPRAIRDRCNEVLELGLAGSLEHFAIDVARLEAVSDYVAEVTRESYPDLQVPIHGRFRHFEVGGMDRIARLRSQLTARSPLERARVLVDLVVPSVLLDAGAGASWKYVEGNSTYARSEGLAVASFDMFAAGAFSSKPDDPYRADAVGLARIDVATVARGFQVSSENPLVGLEGRVGLLRALGSALIANEELFGPEHRMGNIVGALAKKARDVEGRNVVEAKDVLAAILEGLSSIWPGRVTLDGVNLGDVWNHPQVGLVPFHKLSQWLSYSLVEPLAEAGLHVIDLDQLTGLSEYRNGGLFLDLGALVPKHAAVLSAPHTPDDPVIVEWRALTVALLDRVAVGVRARLNRPDLPLANVLQGGTWTAGRKLAAERRGGLPPLDIVSDGTVF